MGVFSRRFGQTGTTCRCRPYNSAWEKEALAATLTAYWLAATKQCPTMNWRETVQVSGKRFWLIPSTMVTIKRVRLTGTKLWCRFCQRQIGVARAYTREEILKVMFAQRQRRSGWSVTVWSIGRIFTPTTGVNCRRDSSISTSKAKPTIGLGSRKFSYRSATSTISSSGMKLTGRCPLRSGPSFTLIPPISLSPRSRLQRGDGRWTHFYFQAVDGRNRDHGPTGGRPADFFQHRGRRYLCRLPSIWPGPARGDVCWCDRSTYPNCTGLAARVSSQARRSL